MVLETRGKPGHTGIIREPFVARPAMSLLARIPLLRNIVPPREHRLRYNDDQDRRAVIRSRLLAIATVAAGLVYLIWLYFALNPHHPWMGAAFLVAEIACLLLFVTASFTVWRLRYKPLEGLALGEPQAWISSSRSAASRSRLSNGRSGRSRPSSGRGADRVRAG